jgi:hypothetical protein
MKSPDWPILTERPQIGQLISLDLLISQFKINSLEIQRGSSDWSAWKKEPLDSGPGFVSLEKGAL